MPGPAPTPTRLKKLRGNPGKRRLNKREPKPEPQAPPIPARLEAETRAVWKRLAPKLKKLGLLTEIDGEHFGRLCALTAIFEQCRKEVAAGVMTTSDRSKMNHPKPEAKFLLELAKILRAYASDFGLHPASRSRLSVSAPEEKEDPFAKFDQEKPQ